MTSCDQGSSPETPKSGYTCSFTTIQIPGASPWFGSVARLILAFPSPPRGALLSLLDPHPGEGSQDSVPGITLQGAGPEHIREGAMLLLERLGRGLVTYFRPRRGAASFGGKIGLREAGAVPGLTLWLRL